MNIHSYGAVLTGVIEVVAPVSVLLPEADEVGTASTLADSETEVAVVDATEELAEVDTAKALNPEKEAPDALGTDGEAVEDGVDEAVVVVDEADEAAAL